jgi:hypothetical protein
MASELSPIDIAEAPELDRLVEEVETTGRRRRFTRGDRDVAYLAPAEEAAPSGAADADAILAELERRRRQGLGVVAATAGILKPYVTRPTGSIQETIRAEKDAFEQAVADDVMGREEA